MGLRRVATGRLGCLRVSELGMIIEGRTESIGRLTEREERIDWC